MNSDLEIPQTSPEEDAALAEWHQERFAEANKPNDKGRGANEQSVLGSQAGCRKQESAESPRPESVDRKAVLLRAAFDLLQKQTRSHYVLNLLEQTAHYDGTACDGHCLMQDIADELDISVNS